MLEEREWKEEKYKTFMIQTLARIQNEFWEIKKPLDLTHWTSLCNHHVARQTANFKSSWSKMSTIPRFMYNCLHPNLGENWILDEETLPAIVSSTAVTEQTNFRMLGTSTVCNGFSCQPELKLSLGILNCEAVRTGQRFLTLSDNVVLSAVPGFRVTAASEVKC